MTTISRHNKTFNIIKFQNIYVYYIMDFMYIDWLNDKQFNCNNALIISFNKKTLLISNSISKYILYYSNNYLISIVY